MISRVPLSSEILINSTFPAKRFLFLVHIPESQLLPYSDVTRIARDSLENPANSKLPNNNRGGILSRARARADSSRCDLVARSIH